jgi:hypothetical protein
MPSHAPVGLLRDHEEISDPSTGYVAGRAAVNSAAAVWQRCERMLWMGPDGVIENVAQIMPKNKGRPGGRP